MATGEAAYDFICGLMKTLEKKCVNLKYTVYKIKNNFFGENITVAGLITGTDLYEQLKGEKLGDMLFLPSSALRSEGDMFLDSMTPAELEGRLGVKITFIENNGYDLVQKTLTAP